MSDSWANVLHSFVPSMISVRWAGSVAPLASASFCGDGVVTFVTLNGVENWEDFCMSTLILCKSVISPALSRISCEDKNPKKQFLPSWQKMTNNRRTR